MSSSTDMKSVILSTLKNLESQVAALRAALTLPQATPPERVSKPLILALAVVASLSGACMSGQHARAIWRLTPA